MPFIPLEGPPKPPSMAERIDAVLIVAATLFGFVALLYSFLRG